MMVFLAFVLGALERIMFCDAEIFTFIMTAIELYRAGGLGAYELLSRVHYELTFNRGRDAWSIETIRALCEDFDRLFHNV